MGRAGTIRPTNCRCHCPSGKRDLPGKIQEELDKFKLNSVVHTCWMFLHNNSTCFPSRPLSSLCEYLGKTPESLYCSHACTAPRLAFQ